MARRPTMWGIDVSSLGDAKLSATIRDLPRVVVRPALAKAMREGFKITHRAVVAAAPVKTGRMRDAIKLRSANHFRDGLGFRIFLPKRVLLGVRPIKNPGSRGGDPNGGGYYPAAVEFGYTRNGKRQVREWISSGIDSRGRPYARKRRTHEIAGGVKVPPRSFMRSAFHATTAAVQTRIRRVMWTEMREQLRAQVGKGGA